MEKWTLRCDDEVTQVRRWGCPGGEGRWWDPRWVRAIHDYRTQDRWLLWNRTDATHFSTMTLSLVSAYSFDTEPFLTQINDWGLTFLPSATGTETHWHRNRSSVRPFMELASGTVVVCSLDFEYSLEDVPFTVYPWMASLRFERASVATAVGRPAAWAQPHPTSHSPRWTRGWGISTVTSRP
jgi:hypothetical protein